MWEQGAHMARGVRKEGCDKKDAGCRGGDGGKEQRENRAEAIGISGPTGNFGGGVDGGRDLTTQEAGTRY